MYHSEKLKDGRIHHWQEHPWSLKENEILKINETNMDLDTYLSCFDIKNWWHPVEDKTKNPHYHRWPGEPEKEWWIPEYSSPPRFILFDSIDGETQIIRFLEFLHPDKKGLKEGGRSLYLPRENTWDDLALPRDDMNPYKVSHPFYDTPTEKYRYHLGGYNGSIFLGNVGECFFWFKKIVPGVKPKEILKRIYTELYQYGEDQKPSGYGNGFNHHIWLPREVSKSIISGKGLFEIIWELGHKKCLYNGYSDTRGLDFRSLEKYRRSFLIARRHGVDFRNQETINLWADTLKLLEESGRDILNPKFIAKDLQETHDALVDRKNREYQKILRRQREAKERKLKEELEKDNEIYQTMKAKFLENTLTSGDIKIIPVQSASDCLEVGIELKNCCFSAGYHKREESLLLKAYVKGCLKELAEINLGDWEINQCRGYRNSETEDHERILDSINKWREKYKKEGY